MTHPAVELMMERQASGSQRGEREDGRVLAVAVEGGGARGTISAGMCIALERLGLVDTVDVIYGTSSGALNGSYTAAGQAAEGSANYEDTANLRLVNPLRWLIGRKIVDHDYLFDEIVRDRRPYSEEGLAAGPDFRAIAVDLEDKTLAVLQDFEDTDELRTAVRASGSMPLVTYPTRYRGRYYIDGGILEPVGHGSALEEGATDVLVLRTRPADADKKPESSLARRAVRRRDPELADLVDGVHERYNEMARDLQSQTEDGGPVFQIAPPSDVIKIARGERSAAKIQQGLIVGAAACTNLLSTVK